MYALIDVETGGFSKSKNGLCEIGMLILDKDRNIIESFNSLIKPYKRPESDELVSYKPDAMAINGIKLEDLDKADSAELVAAAVENLLIKHNIKIIVGHNIKTMDQQWIEFFLERFGTAYKFQKAICTLEIARSKKLNTIDNKLDTLCEAFNISIMNSHRALDDAHATLQLWKILA